MRLRRAVGRPQHEGRRFVLRPAPVAVRFAKYIRSPPCYPTRSRVISRSRGAPGADLAGDETGTSRQRRRSLQRAGVPDSWLSEPAQSDELGAFMVSGDR